MDLVDVCQSADQAARPSSRLLIHIWGRDLIERRTKVIDLLIKNAKTIDGKRIEIAVQSGKIHEVGATLTYDATDVSEELDLGGDS